MDNTRLLIVAMAEKCRGLIQDAEGEDFGLSESLRPEHLLWMCRGVEQHAEDWPDSKLHRWIGFIQCGMMANRMLDLGGIKQMFDDAKHAYGNGLADQDLIDHLDPASTFRLEVGGEA